MKRIITCFALLAAGALHAQDSTGLQTPATGPFTISGYVEGYYNYDFNRPPGNNRPGFLYNFNRHNEFNLNLGLVRGAYSTDRVRANLAFGTGTYMNANYAAEPGTIKNIFEANAGYKLSAKKNWWFDIGILPSHIGFEGAVGKDNWTLTRSIVAENSPYFESGAKLSYTSGNGRLMVAGLALNGWQRITRVEGSSLVSFGTQVYYKPSDKITLNYSTFTGTDKPDSARRIRIYHDLYGIFQFSARIGLILGIDIGTEEKTAGGHGHNALYSPVGILCLTPADKWAVALRGEYYSDRNGIIIATGTPNGFKTAGASLNIDYLPLKNAALRLEGRTFNSKDRIFAGKNNSSHANTALTFSTAIGF